jgi:hypothetical protein
MREEFWSVELTRSPYTPTYRYTTDVNSVFQDVSPLNRGNTIPTRVDIPPAAPGYRRTPDLLRLIGFLNEFTQK